MEQDKKSFVTEENIKPILYSLFVMIVSLCTALLFKLGKLNAFSYAINALIIFLPFIYPRKTSILTVIAFLGLILLFCSVLSDIHNAKNIKNLNGKIVNTKKYQYISQLNAKGELITGSLSNPTHLSKKLKETNLNIQLKLIDQEKILYSYTLITNCSKNSITTYKNIIDQTPEFPFTYVALADCYYKDKDYEKANYYKKKALNILNITIEFPGAQLDHGAAVKILNQYIW